jgi:hypothetical protein
LVDGDALRQVNDGPAAITPTWGGFDGEVPQSMRYLAIGKPPGSGARCQVRAIWVAAGVVAMRLVGAGGNGTVVADIWQDGAESS